MILRAFASSLNIIPNYRTTFSISDTLSLLIVAVYTSVISLLSCSISCSCLVVSHLFFVSTTFPICLKKSRNNFSCILLVATRGYCTVHTLTSTKQFLNP